MKQLLTNAHNMFAVKVVKPGDIAGHLSKKISSCNVLYILRHGGVIACKITDPKK